MRRARSGQALLEYVLLLSFATAIAVGFSSGFGSVLNTSIQTFNAVLELELAPGNFPNRLTLWRN